GVTWIQLGADVTKAATTIYDGTADVEIGAQVGGTQNNLAGKVYYAEVRNGIDGTVVAKFNPSANASLGATTFASSTGGTWTLAGAAAISTVGQDQVKSTTYTALNQVASRTDVDGTLTQYTYDNVGNLTQTVKAVNTSDTRTLLAQYDKQGRLTAQLSGNGAGLLTGTQTQAQIDAIWAANAVKYTY